MCKKVLVLLSFIIPFQLLFAQTKLLTDFPKGCTPQEVGKRLAYHFVDGKHMLHGPHIQWIHITVDDMW